METKKKIFLASPHMSEEGFEQQYIREAFEQNWIAPLGPNVDGFERELCEKVGGKAAAALSSGTAAIHLALKLAGVGAGDLVFCSSLTFAATVNPVVYQDGIPVFIDSDRKTWNMSPAALERAFQIYEAKGKLPKAVIVVHLYGMSAEMEPICQICRRYGVPIIEDAAESLGTTYQGIYTGTIGQYGVFSFNGNKIITTSGGGMLLFNDDNPDEAESKAAKARFWSTQSRDPARCYQHSELGYNYRMSNIVAGIGRGQLRVLEQRIAKKKAIFNYYKEALGDLPGLQFMPLNPWNAPNFWLTCITLDGDCSVTPLALMDALQAENIESRPVWKPMHLQPVFADCDFITASPEAEGGKDVAGDLFQRGVCLPSDTKMTQVDMEKICEIIRGLWTG